MASQMKGIGVEKQFLGGGQERPPCFGDLEPSGYEGPGMKSDLGVGREKGSDKGLVPTGGCTCWAGLGFKSCSSMACAVSCLALELSSVKWVHRGMVSLELIQKQGAEHLHLASPSEDLLPFILFW